MIAVCDAEAADATARGSNRCGTSAGRSACIVGISNARAQPMTNTSAKIACSVIQPIALPAASAAATSERDDLAHAEDAPAIEAVRRCARRPAPSANDGQELHEADETQVRARCPSAHRPASPTATVSIWYAMIVATRANHEAGERSVGEDGVVDRGEGAVHARFRERNPPHDHETRESIPSLGVGQTRHQQPSARPTGTVCNDDSAANVELLTGMRSTPICASARDEFTPARLFDLRTMEVRPNAWFSS